MAIPTSTHWGNYKIVASSGRIQEVQHYEEDIDRTPLADNLLAAQDKNLRVLRPAVRESYLKQPTAHTGAARGQEPFVQVPWDEALDLAASALERIRRKHGNAAIYGGSYGWSSAGRFHHAQSQIHRFLNSIGGYTRSLFSYSAGAGEVIVPRVLGVDFFEVMFQAPTLEDIAEHTKLVVCFGGLALKNTQVMSGGMGGHNAESRLRALADRDIDFINISPIANDMPEFLNGDWWPIRPGADAACMLAIAHTLVKEKIYDHGYVSRFSVGLEQFTPYLLGETDGTPKDCAWASAICGISASRIQSLARRMAKDKPMIGISWSLQRSEHGEQTYWLATVLGALLGTHGLPGKGVSYGYGSIHNIGFCGRKLPNFTIPSLSQGERGVGNYIPVARIADVLLDPCAPIEFNGKTIEPNPIELIYWAGGNPFHHHQDLNRLCTAWTRPQTIIVNEPFWTATAKRADIVFPATVPLEREDLGITPYDCTMTPMRRVVPPIGEARDDYDTFLELAKRLGSGDAFSEGKSSGDWLQALYTELVENASVAGVQLPEFDAFWQGEQLSLLDQVPNRVFRLEKFYQDPESNELATPSGKIEIYSATIDSFNYDDCAGHPRWYDKEESLSAPRAASYPLHLISNQPKGRLHSQYDHGSASRANKVDGRECVRMHPSNAKARGIADGNTVRLYNDRGECLAIAIVTDRIAPDVLELPTGAWYDPSGAGGLELHGNPNVLTRDKGSSQLGQGTTAHSCLVEMEKYSSATPAVKAHHPPEFSSP